MPVLDLVRTFILFYLQLHLTFSSYPLFLQQHAINSSSVSSLNVPLTCYLQQHHLQCKTTNYITCFLMTTYCTTSSKTLPTALPIFMHDLTNFIAYCVSCTTTNCLTNLISFLLLSAKDVPIISVTYSSFCFFFPVPINFCNSTTYTTCETTNNFTHLFTNLIIIQLQKLLLDPLRYLLHHQLHDQL